MERVKRFVFFWFLVVLFFITTPIIVLNARGYRFDTDRGVFVYGGAITLKTNPQNVELSLNKKITDSKRLNRINNSYNISGLMPDDYDVKVSSSGFQTWSKKVDVHSGLATEFWNILLVRNSYEVTDFGIEKVKKFFISPKNEFIIYTQDTEEGFSLRITDIKNKDEEIQFDFSDWTLADESREENIEWSPDEKFLSIPVEKKSNIISYLETENQNDYIIIDVETGKNFMLSEKSSKNNLKNVRWNSGNGEFLFFLSEKELYRINIEDETDITQIAENVSSFDISGSYVYYASFDNNILFKNKFDTEKKPVQITSGFPEEKFKPIIKIIVYDDSRIVLFSENKEFFVYNEGEHKDYFRKLADEISGASFSDDGKKLLFWSNNEISLYFTRDELSQPMQSENEMQNITRFSRPLKNVQWFSDYEHVIFSSDNYVKIIEIDPRDKINCMDLTQSKLSKPFVVYNNHLEKLFFTDSKNDSVGLFSINFPEKNSLFFIGD